MIGVSNHNLAEVKQADAILRELENVADSLGINVVRSWEKKMD